MAYFALKAEGVDVQGVPGSLEKVMQVLDTKKEQDLSVASRVSVQLQLTDPSLKSRDRIVKKSEKDSLYAAMDVAAIWLERALKEK